MVWYLNIDVKQDEHGKRVMVTTDEHGIERHYKMEIDKNNKYITLDEENSEGILTMPLSVFDFMFVQLKCLEDNEADK